MSAFWVSGEEWLLRSALGGALLLAITWLVVRKTEQPAKQQRLVEWGLSAALLLTALCWLQPWTSYTINQIPSPIPDPASKQSSHSLPPHEGTGTGLNQVSHTDSLALSKHEVNPRESTDFPHENSIPGESSNDWLALELAIDAIPTINTGNEHSSTPGIESDPVSSQSPSIALSWFSLETSLKWLLVAYWIGAVAVLGRWLVGLISLARLIHKAQSPSEGLHEMLAQLAPANARLPRLLISDSIEIPLCCGIWQPTIVLPRNMAATGSEKASALGSLP